MTRRPDRDVLLDLVPEQGTIGNVSLQQKLGWDAKKYWKIRDELLTDGLLERGRGKGGSVRRSVDALAARPLHGPAETQL